ncbi:nucleolar and spindle-associated protein 1 isoform X2 [Larimichthys crocea]|uniref:nucleolar and spindle-associated protein 1 isoform X2 n=1 Tax=Larimichthys crocea TaxID=215358 RepID=UPI000F5E1101|nr:nucleolar and spindle-associated protein 1 isoform X2 [Larimichthys crocea]
MDLDSMKYAELQSLAKELGIKANVKADKLLKAIKQHYEQEKDKQEEVKEDKQEEVKEVKQEEEVKEEAQEKDSVAVQEDNNETPDSARPNEEVSSPAVFVNTRRGKGNGTKRKISDTATECDGKLPPSAAEVAPASNKKRKVSSAKDAGQSEAEHPEELLQQPDTKDDTEKAPKVARAGRIPRYQGVQLKSKLQLKPVTPNFKKLHEAHFNKMESIDSYVQRKTKQSETHRASVKDLKNLLDKTKQQQPDAKAKVNPIRASMFSPAQVNKKAAEEKRRQTLLSASKAPPKKPAVKEDAPFRPSVLSTRRINVRFSEATHDNEYKKSLVKTPARMSPCVASSTPQKPTTDGGKPNNVKTAPFSATKTPGTFVFTGNTSTTTTPGTQKSAFDLKASLARPLTYKPHAGKLKPFGEAKENTAGNKSLISANSHQKNYKQPKVQTREDRRAKHTEGRKQKKESALGTRRGLVMM